MCLFVEQRGMIKTCDCRSVTKLLHVMGNV